MSQHSPTETGWQHRREGGSKPGLRLIRWVALHVSARIARISLYPITLYFLIMRSAERQASRAYLQRVLKRKPTLLQIARHIHSFATTILDRVFLLTNRFDTTRVRVHGLSDLRQYLDAGRGVLLMGSHFGSFEAVRATGLANDKLTLRILMDYQHNAQLSTILDALNPRARDSIIDAGGESTRVLLQIHETLTAGGLVGILADRARTGEHTLECSLLGAPAALPSGPFRLAAVLRQPVMLIFGVLRPDNTYDVYFEKFADEITLGRRSEREQALHDWMRQYAQRLEHHMLDAPYNWFNFYDFWSHPTSPQA